MRYRRLEEKHVRVSRGREIAVGNALAHFLVGVELTGPVEISYHEDSGSTVLTLFLICSCSTSLIERIEGYMQKSPAISE